MDNCRRNIIKVIQLQAAWGWLFVAETYKYVCVKHNKHTNVLDH